LVSVPRTELDDSLRGRYTIERELGRGGMAVVFVARDLRHERAVALKVLNAELIPQQGATRFQREIRLAARLQHPHILTVLDSGELADGRLWYTMPLVEGESLRERLRREGALLVEEAVRIACEVAEGLDYAHGHGVIHRDIKPANILLAGYPPRDGTTSGGWHALIADFGIARALEDTGPHATPLDQTITQAGSVMGSPTYMSPEQASGERALDGRADQYALAVVVYEMLAGTPPFTGTTPHAVLAKHLMAQRPPVTSPRRPVPPAIDAAIRKALAPEPDERFATAAEFARTLEEGVQRPAASAWPRTRGVWAALLAGLLLAGGAGAWWALHRGGASSGTPAGGRLAVLPFENVGAAENEYFADGVADAVRGKLSALPGLQVIASTSSDQYRHTSKSMREIGRELGARYLVVGKVRWQRGVKTNRVQVSPELIEASTGTTRWQQLFDAPYTDVFGVQEGITRGVASALELEVDAGEQQQLGERPTSNLAAYDAFLRGERLSNRVAITDAPALRSAIDAYESATALDTGFALAWAQLSRARSTLYVNGPRNPEDAEAARVAADRAVALAPDLPQARFAHALYLSAVRREHVRALEEVARARRIAPKDPELLTMAALGEQQLGRWDQALAHFRQAYALDPRSFGIRRRLTRVLLWLRRYDEARAMADSTLAVSGASPDVLDNKLATYLAKGDLEGARATFRSATAEAEPTRLIAHMGAFLHMCWVLDDDQRRLLLRLGPGAFDGDRGMWGMAMAQAYGLRGEWALARAYADSALPSLQRTAAGNPKDGMARGQLGLALAYAGRHDEAVREAERAVQVEPVASNAITGPVVLHYLVLTYLRVGNREAATDRLAKLLRVPYFISPAWVRIDPSLAPLRAAVSGAQ
jgi:serine/threonine-protein kinase